MKTKLLFSILLLSFIGYSQTPISTYYSLPMTTYAVVTSNGAVDQTASGANLTWNFTDLATDGTMTVDTYAAPTAGELSSYPGTTLVMTVTDNSMETNKIFTENVTNTVSYTGAERTDLTLNYTDNALVGTFPLSYSTSTSDAVSGNFNYTTFSGTFVGTFDVTVDAYGTLNMNDLGEGAFSGNVTRLKMVQNLTLTVPFVGSVPASQTAYNYYDASNGNLVFRTNNLVVSLLAVDETIMESILPLSTLGVQENTLTANQVKIIPNLVDDMLHIQSKNEIRSVTLTDLNGRIVLKEQSNASSIAVSQLGSGLYIATIVTDKGNYTQKFIKK